MMGTPVIVDSTEILDIVIDDPVWADWSDGQLIRLQPAGLLVNPIIYSELCAWTDASAGVDMSLK